MATDRYVCTKEAPWRPEFGKFAIHPDAIDDGESLDGDCDCYYCPNCGLRFEVELPQ